VCVCVYVCIVLFFNEQLLWNGLKGDKLYFCVTMPCSRLKINLHAGFLLDILFSPEDGHVCSPKRRLTSNVFFL
jgi:hypothetical protein